MYVCTYKKETIFYYQPQMQNQLPNQLSNQMVGPMGTIQTSMPQQMNQIGPGQLSSSQMQQQLNHIQRKVC